jgi:hypothetical protein
MEDRFASIKIVSTTVFIVILLTLVLFIAFGMNVGNKKNVATLKTKAATPALVVSPTPRIPDNPFAAAEVTQVLDNPFLVQSTFENPFGEVTPTGTVDQNYENPFEGL